ncbi:cytochrome P450 [Colletotrichum costaricense]|uniref:Cytochrome P450 n=1 Tax=Colletotrichum costaricense TaxID=1209916 RepID=A0AAI9Z5A3_9PEZI|nr:cytochrome P450 [Colletotrichum costaricense]KAK1534673.1 cytochrome P450 [Colletotrichum costaricense]
MSPQDQISEMRGTNDTLVLPSLYGSFALCALTLLSIWYLASWHRLRHIPGPFLNSLSILPMQHMTRGGKLSFMLKDLGDKYGPLVRVGPNEVLFGDPDTYRKISAVRSDFTKGPWYALAKVVPDQDSLFSMRDDDLRKEYRAKLSPGYAGRENGGFEPGVDRIVAHFVNLVETKYISTPKEFRPIEFSHKSQYFALDVVSELSFGEALGFLANDEDLFGYVATNDLIFPYLAVMLNVPWVGIFLQQWPLNKLLPFSSDEFGFGKLMGMAKNLADKKLAAASDENNMVQQHLRNGVTYKELLAEIFLELIAGSDSTATAVRMTMLCLLNTPSSLNALRREMDQGIAQGRISSPIRDSEARQLPYLQAVIREGIRMYPPSTGLNYKQVAKGGTELHGQFLPEGTQMGINIQKLMRSKDTFGCDADVFRPERWLEAAAEDEDCFRDMCGVVDLAFGHGRFQCLGKTIAAMELNKIFIELFRRFDFAVVTPQEPLKLYDAAFWVTTNFWLRVVPRPSEFS